jgi:tetratricopeptide (TPR) repeat protein
MFIDRNGAHYAGYALRGLEESLMNAAKTGSRALAHKDSAASRRVAASLIGTGLLSALVLTPTMPAAQSRQPDETICFSENATLDAAIASCGRLIASGNVTAQALSRAYDNRGIAWLGKREFDHAIEDFSAAIRLDPSKAGVFGRRGYVWLAKRNYDRAISDYDEAIRLDPRKPEPFFDRAMAWENKGDFDRAISDLSEVIRIDPPQDVELVSKNKDFGFQRSPRSEQPDQAAPDQPAKIAHPWNYRPIRGRESADLSLR